MEQMKSELAKGLERERELQKHTTQDLRSGQEKLEGLLTEIKSKENQIHKVELSTFQLKEVESITQILNNLGNKRPEGHCS
jgi:cell division FtsZ-interacting protein ZapD